MLGYLEKYRDFPVAHGGLTVGNFACTDVSAGYEIEEISAAFDSLEDDGWIKTHSINGVKHAVLRSDR